MKGADAGSGTPDHVLMDPVFALVALYRVVGSLFVLRWPFWGSLVAIVCDLCDLLLFNLFVVYAGWTGFVGYQTFDKWADQVYLAAFLIVAICDFAPLPKRIAVALYLFRLVGFVAFEVGIAPREALFLFPNLFEFWFVAVAFTMRFRASFVWTPVLLVGILSVPARRQARPGVGPPCREGLRPDDLPRSARVDLARADGTVRNRLTVGAVKWRRGSDRIDDGVRRDDGSVRDYPRAAMPNRREDASR